MTLVDSVYTPVDRSLTLGDNMTTTGTGTTLRTWKRKSGVYYITYDRGTRATWISTGLRDHTDVIAKFQNQSTLPQPQLTRSLRLSEFIPIFEERSTGHIRPGTLRGYKLALAQFQTAIGDKHLSAIDSLDIHRFCQTRLQDKVTPTTVNIGLRYIRAVLAKAKKWEYIQTTPPVEMLHQTKLPPRFLTDGEFWSIHDSAKDQRMKDIFAFAMYTGCRISEILSLPWKHVLFESNQIIIGNWEKYETKNNRTRSIPMHVKIRILIEKLKVDSNGSELVFNHDGKKWSPLYVSTQFKKACVDARIDNAHFHTLRHTFASMLVQSGVPIYSVSKLLGHSEIKTTEIYSHLSPSSLQNHVDMLRKRPQQKVE